MRTRRERDNDVERALCPVCGCANTMRVLAQAWTRAWVEPKYPHPRVETAIEGEPTWDSTSPCECGECGYTGTVREFVGSTSADPITKDWT